MQETWIPITQESRYEVSTLGRIKRISELGTNLLKGGIGSSGYLSVTLQIEGKDKTFRIHRLVAEHFLENLENVTDVNHIDGNKLNNRLDNLEWVTRSENMIHAYELGLVKQKSNGEGANCKKILQFDIKNNFIKEFSGVRVAERELNISSTSISLACKGKRKSAGGFIWKYKES